MFTSICIAVLTLFIFASKIWVPTFAISIPRRIIYENSNLLCKEDEIYLELSNLLHGCYPIAEKIYELCLRNEQCLVEDSFCGIREYMDDSEDYVIESVEHVCMCNDGFVANWDNSTCEPYRKCSRMDFNDQYTQEDCEQNEFCRIGNCLCKPNFWFNSKGKCEWNVPDEEEISYNVRIKEHASEQIHPKLIKPKSKSDYVIQYQWSIPWKLLLNVWQLVFGFALVIILYNWFINITAGRKMANCQEEDDHLYQKRVDSICNFNDPEDDTKLANIEEDDTFHDANKGDPTIYQLGQTDENIVYYWLKHSISNNQVAPLYKDNKQKKYDQLVLQLEEDLINHQTPQLDFAKLECSRLIQSFIEVMQFKLTCDKMYKFADWFRQMLAGIETKESLNLEIVKLLEQLYQYMQLSQTSLNASKCHNISVIVLALFKCDYFQHSEIEHFLLHFIKKHIRPKFFITEPLLILSTFDCFEKFNHNKQSFLKNQLIILNINWWAELFGHLPPVSRLYSMSAGDLQRLQTGMCAKWLRDHVLGSQELKQSNEPATLNLFDRTENLKLSSDCLSARSDCFDRNQWQSIRSMCPVNSDFSDTFYYEAILFTDGPMRIGWATSRTVLSRTFVGGDENSIAFDGYNQCIWHENKRIELMTPNNEVIPQWKSGDIVGCLVDVSANSFAFYLNEQPVYFQPLGYFAKRHNYFAAVSLPTFQQCRFNFGPIERPPSQTEFHTFNSQLFKLRKSAENFFNNIQNSFIQVDSKANIKGNVRIQQLIEESLKSNP